jgi:sugar/nucleoside kinase (ribokinase family)
MNGLFFGLTTIDIQYFVEEFPAANTKVKVAESPDVIVGGPAANAAVAFSYLGGDSHLVSVFGQNPFKGVLDNDMRDQKINFYDLVSEIKREPIVASVITSIENGDRTIFTNNPADIEIEIDIDSIFSLTDFQLLLVDGFYIKSAIKMAKEAKNRGITVVFDGGSWKPGLEKLLPHVDYAICSENFLPPKCENSDDVFEYLSKINIQCVAVTRGGKSIHYKEGNEFSEVKVPQITPIDTLGAGDIFHGAFSYYLLKNSLFCVALEKASIIAAKSCLYAGTRLWMTKNDRLK